MATESIASEPSPPAMGHGALFMRFLRFGLLAFGGPVAQIAMIRRALVEEERWVSNTYFNRLLAVMQALPGPEAHELCVHLGIRAKGRLGGLLAGLGFMLPGLVLMMALGWLYTSIAIAGTALAALFLGVQAAVVGVVARAVQRIGAHILHDGWLWGTALGAAWATLLGLSFWQVLLAAGIVYAIASSGPRWRAWLALGLLLTLAAVLHPVMGDPSGLARLSSATSLAPSALALFVAGLKGGLLTFGGAYTAIPFVRADTVGRGWMSDGQFLDGLGLAGVLPAPLVIFATFVGFVSGGPIGALAITAGMFLPAFAFSLIFYERLEAVVEDRRLQSFLAGVAAGVVGLIAVTLLDLAGVALFRSPSPPVSIGVAAVALIIVWRWKSVLATPAALAIGGIAGLLAL